MTGGPSLGSGRERRAYRRSRHTAFFALAGMLDISLSCLMLAGVGVVESLLWGLVGAAAYGLFYLVLWFALEFSGHDPTSDASALDDDDDPFGGFLDDVDDDEDDGEPLSWWDNLEVWVITIVVVGGMALWYAVLSHAKSIFVVAVFASLSPDPSFLGFLVVVVVGGAAQVLAMVFGFMPAAKRRGFNL